MMTEKSSSYCGRRMLKSSPVALFCLTVTGRKPRIMGPPDLL